MNDVFRIISFLPADSKEDILLITNIFWLCVETITQMYRHQRNIEVFFRFLKQELNSSHSSPSMNTGYGSSFT
jgi:transposase